MTGLEFYPNFLSSDEGASLPRQVPEAFREIVSLLASGRLFLHQDDGRAPTLNRPQKNVPDGLLTLFEHIVEGLPACQCRPCCERSKPTARGALL
jgi:hypothetical protein